MGASALGKDHLTVLPSVPKHLAPRACCADIQPTEESEAVVEHCHLALGESCGIQVLIRRRTVYSQTSSVHRVL